MIKRDGWIDRSALQNYILACQYEEGGIGDRPGNEVDVFHTFFGCASLSLLDKEKFELVHVNEIYAMPEELLKTRCPHLGI